MQKLKDPEAGQRIILATGLDGIAVDPKQLSYDLKIAWDLARNSDLVGSPAVSKQMIRELKLFASAARHLKVRLNGLGRRARVVVNGRLAQHFERPDEFMGLLDDLAGDADDMVHRNSAVLDEPPKQPAESGSTFERFVGGELAEIYARHFGLKPEMRRDAGRRPTGPFIAFCLAALVELKIQSNGRPYSAGAVGRALTSARTNRLRPKRLGKGARER